MKTILDVWLDDLPQQFRGLPKLETLITAFARQLQEVERVFQDLSEKTDLKTAVGQNLDYIGTVVSLTRKEAGILSGCGRGEEVLPDERYRQLLGYKLLLNTNECTYYDLIAGLQLLWGTGSLPIYYHEDPSMPATIILGGEMPFSSDVQNLMSIPTPRPAGVGLEFRFVLRESADFPAACIGMGAAAQVYQRIQAGYIAYEERNAQPLSLYRAAGATAQVYRRVQAGSIVSMYVLAGTTWSDLLKQGLAWGNFPAHGTSWRDFVPAIHTGIGAIASVYQSVQADTALYPKQIASSPTIHIGSGTSVQVSRYVRVRPVGLWTGADWESLLEQDIPWSDLLAQGVVWENFIAETEE